MKLNAVVDIYTWKKVVRMANERGTSPEALASSYVDEQSEKIFAPQVQPTHFDAREVQPTQKGA